MGVRNAVIGWPRWTEDLTVTGDFDPLYPGQNLTSLPLSRIARLPSTSAQITMTLPRSRPIRCLALVRHNLTLHATMRIRMYAESTGMSLVYDSGEEDVWPVVYPASQIDWESDNFWSAKYTPDQIKDYAWTRPVWLDRAYLAQRIEIAISDPSNLDGSLDIGLIEVSEGWQISTNFDFGAEYGFRFRTSMNQAMGGAKYGRRKPKGRVFQGSIPDLPRDEAMARGFEFLRQADLDTPFLWLPDPQDQVNWLRNCFLATLSEPDLMAYAEPDGDSFPIRLEEVFG